jgi:hypothetical protein
MVRARRLMISAAGIVTAMVLVGCGAGEDGGLQTGDDALPAAPEDAGEAAADQRGVGDPGGEGGELVDIRAIIYTGHITVRVDDVDGATDSAGALALRYGGFVGADRRTSDDERSNAELVLRIPTEHFTAAVARLGELGDEESREIETEDVTADVVDLETRIATAEASVARTRELMEQATSIDDIVRIEGELAGREGELARLQARQRTLDDLTTLSTITVWLLGPEAKQDEDGTQTGFLAGLSGGWDAFTTSLRLLATTFGAVLPFLVAFGVPVGAALWWARRRRQATAPAE